MGLSSDIPSASFSPDGKENMALKVDESLLRTVRWTWKTDLSETCRGRHRKRGHIEEGVLDEEHTASVLKVIDVVVHQFLVHCLILFWRS